MDVKKTAVQPRRPDFGEAFEDMYGPRGETADTDVEGISEDRALQLIDWVVGWSESAREDRYGEPVPPRRVDPFDSRALYAALSDGAQEVAADLSGVGGMMGWQGTGLEAQLLDMMKEIEAGRLNPNEPKVWRMKDEIARLKAMERDFQDLGEAIRGQTADEWKWTLYNMVTRRPQFAPRLLERLPDEVFMAPRPREDVDAPGEEVLYPEPEPEEPPLSHLRRPWDVSPPVGSLFIPPGPDDADEGDSSVAPWESGAQGEGVPSWFDEGDDGELMVPDLAEDDDEENEMGQRQYDSSGYADYLNRMHPPKEPWYSSENGDDENSSGGGGGGGERGGRRRGFVWAPAGGSGAQNAGAGPAPAAPSPEAGVGDEDELVTAEDVSPTAGLGVKVQRAGYQRYRGEHEGSTFKIRLVEAVEHGSYGGGQRQRRAREWEVEVDGKVVGTVGTLREAKDLVAENAKPAKKAASSKTAAQREDAFLWRTQYMMSPGGPGGPMIRQMETKPAAEVNEWVRQAITAGAGAAGMQDRGGLDFRRADGARLRIDDFRVTKQGGGGFEIVVEGMVVPPPDAVAADGVEAAAKALMRQTHALEDPAGLPANMPSSQRLTRWTPVFARYAARSEPWAKR